MVAAGEDFDAAGEQFLGDARRDAEAGGGIFAVGDAEIDFALGGASTQRSLSKLYSQNVECLNARRAAGRKRPFRSVPGWPGQGRTTYLDSPAR